MAAQSQGQIAEGWKEIARALEVDEKTARGYMRRNVDPLPVRKGHRGWYAIIAALEAWVIRQDRSGQDVLRMRAMQARIAELETARPAGPDVYRRRGSQSAKDR